MGGVCLDKRTHTIVAPGYTNRATRHIQITHAHPCTPTLFFVERCRLAFTHGLALGQLIANMGGLLVHNLLRFLQLPRLPRLLPGFLAFFGGCFLLLLGAAFDMRFRI